MHSKHSTVLWLQVHWRCTKHQGIVEGRKVALEAEQLKLLPAVLALSVISDWECTVEYE